MNIQKLALIKEIQEVKVISEKFSVQSVIVETIEDYPQHFPIQFANDRMKLVEKLNVGDSVNFTIDIRGREYQNKKTNETNHFISLNCWGAEVVEMDQKETPKKNKPSGNIEKRFEDDAINSMTEEDDLPF